MTTGNRTPNVLETPHEPAPVGGTATDKGGRPKTDKGGRPVTVDGPNRRKAARADDQGDQGEQGVDQ